MFRQKVAVEPAKRRDQINQWIKDNRFSPEKKKKKKKEEEEEE